MKRLILFAAILFGLAAIARAQTTEKIKTKIEGQSFKKKTKTEGDAQKVSMSTSAHPAYVHHTATKHHYTLAKRYTSSRARHVAHAKPGYRHVTHYNSAHVTQYKSTNVGHYNKIKRKHENGEYKVKFKI
jgi:hypothetical protein